jgi:putative ABC transport system substrate-binding protein
MRRREFLGVLAGAAAAWPVVARAQQSAMPVVGFASSGSAGTLRLALAGFEDGLKEAGYIAGQNVTVEYRFAEGQFDRFPGFISEFIQRKASVIVTTSFDGALAAKKATSTIPIVFSIGDDPVKLGIVPSLNRPGGNLTGVYQFAAGLEGKRLGLLHEMVPHASTLGVLLHPNFGSFQSQLRDVQEAAARLGVKLVVTRANAEVNSTLRSRPSLNRRPGRFWSVHLHSSISDASNWSCWRHVTVFRRSTNGASSSKRVV